MTGADTMTEFTPEAGQRLAEYLRQVRVAVARSAEVSPDEIEADIREHIDNEFRAAPGPVTLARLEAVLARLGPPTQWVPSAPGAAPPLAGQIRSLGEWFRQTRRAAFDALWRGPEDWRLAYLTFAVFALGVVVFPLFPLFLAVSYLLGRAARAAAAEKGVALGARRWLVYPPLVVVGLPLLLATLFWPVAAGAGASHELWEADRFRQLVRVREDGGLAFTRPVEWHDVSRLGIRKTADGKWEMSAGRRAYYEWLNRAVDALPGPRPVSIAAGIVFAAAGAVLAWWAVLGGVAWRFPGLPRAVFAPLLGGFDAAHGRRLFGLGLAGFLLWCGFAYNLASAASLAPDPADPVAIEAVPPVRR